MYSDSIKLASLFPSLVRFNSSIFHQSFLIIIFTFEGFGPHIFFFYASRVLSQRFLRCFWCLYSICVCITWLFYRFHWVHLLPCSIQYLKYPLHFHLSVYCVISTLLGWSLNLVMTQKSLFFSIFDLSRL